MKKLLPKAIALLSACAFFVGLFGPEPTLSAKVAQHPAASYGAEEFAELGDFRLASGAVIHNLRLGFRTFGRLDAAKSNTILWPTWLGGRTADLVQFVGPGRVLDDRRYFVILVDAIGNGVSTSPSNSASQSGMAFPEFTIRDMVESERRLLEDVLHVSHLRAVVGISMGGMQAFEWVAAHPDFMDLAVSIAGSPQATSYDKLLWTAQIHAIELDPAWNHGHPTGPLGPGLALEREIGALNATSPAYRVAHTDPAGFPDFLAGVQKEGGSDPLAAIDAIRQRETILEFDLPAEFGGTMASAAARVNAKLMVVVSPEDHTVNPAPATQLARQLGAPLIELDSPCGHMSPSCISIGPLVAQFLADPGSVHSATLHDPRNAPP